MRFDDFADRWQRDILPLKRPATVATMKSHIGYLRKEFGNRSLSELNHPTVQSYFTRLARTSAAKTVRNVWSTLHVVLVQARDEGLLPLLPKPVLPKGRRPPQDWLDLAGMRALLHVAGEPRYTFYWLLCETGLRVGEALGLQLGDLDLEHLRLRIRRDVFNGRIDDVKTYAAERTLAVSGRLADLLQAHIAKTFPDNEPVAVGAAVSPHLFPTRTGRPWWLSNETEKLHEALRHAGQKPMGFHAFRRGNRQLMRRLEVPREISMYRMGHSPQEVHDLYDRVEAGEDKVWAEKIGEALR